jgi:hypothetical protein
MAFGLTEVNYALKRIYPKRPPENIASWPHPFLSHTSKDDTWTGEENFKQGVEYTNPQGIGGDFAKAQTASVTASTIGVAFDVPRRWKNGFALIRGKAIVATGNNEGAFFKAVKRETDNGIRAYGDRLSVEAINGDGLGNLGRVTNIAGSVVTVGGTVAERWIASRFKQGMTLNRSTDGTLANIQAESYVVQKVNPKAGTITLNNVVNLANGNYLAAAGDYEEGGLHGVFTWIPLTEPGAADSFFTVNRSAQPTLLSGHRLDSSTASNSVKEQAMDLSTEMATMGSIDDDGTLDGYLHPYQHNRLSKELDAQTKRDQDEKTGRFGHAYIEQQAGGKLIKWYQDADFPADRMFITARKAWVIRHAMGFPHLNEDDGNSALRAPTSDSIEVRMRSAGNLFNIAPGACGVAPLTPPA